MKKLITILLTIIFVMSMNSMILAQNAPIDFETGGNGADWTWTTFENDTNPPLEIVANPDATGDNTSATVAQFTALQLGNPWAGCESQHGADIGTFTLDETNCTIKIMVWKPVISDVGIKFVLPSSEALGEIKVPNTVTNQWEELTFDFSSRIGHPSTIGQDQIVIFMDFDMAGRTQDNICYFDNITFSEQGGSSEGPEEPAPDPTVAEENVISIYSDTYTDVAGTNFFPSWGQATVASEVLIDGNNTLLYTGLNYQGIELGSHQNVSGAGMTHVHVDFWTENSTELSVYLISTGPVEVPYALTVPTTGWASVDIPLSVFSPVDLADVFQFKFVGNGDVYLDNIYFTSSVTDIEEVPVSVATAYALEQNYPNPFNPTTTIRVKLPQTNHVTMKVYNMMGQEVATLVNKVKQAGVFEVNFDAKDLPSGTYIYSITAGSFTSVKKMLLLK